MSICLTDHDLAAYVAGSATFEQMSAWNEHLDGCHSCARRVIQVQADRSKPLQSSGGTGAKAQTITVKPPVDAALDAGAGLPEDAIPGYRILKELHRGGQGVVYQAVQEAAKRKVALKVMLEGPFASKDAKRRFEREIALVGSLRHPGIVPIFDSGVAQGRFYYAMEYIRGERLDEYVHSRKLSVDDTLRLFKKVCDAVDYAHQKGVIHRDLKPSNILVNDAGEPHVLDFGLAKVGGAEADDTLVSVTGQVMGTPAYMSPEQARGRPDQVDMRSDVYALGVILYELLTGQLPYELSGAMAENLTTIQQAEPLRPRTVCRQINDEVETVVLKALAKSKERRYATAGMLGQDIARFLADEPIEAKRDSVLYVLRKTLRRYKVPAAVAAAFVFLVTLSAVALSFLYYRADAQAVIARQQSAEALRQRQEADRNLYHALVGEARALRLARRVGYRSQAWARLEQALALDTSEKDLDELRREAVACMGDFLGLEPTTWQNPPTDFIPRNFAADLHPQAPLLAIGLKEGTVLLRSLATGQEVARLGRAPSLRDGRVSSLTFGQDGSRLVTARRDGTIRVWEPNGHNSWTMTGTFSVGPGWPTVALSPDGKRVAVGTSGLPDWQGAVSLWDPVDGTRSVYFGDPGRVSCVAFSPDGTFLAAGYSAGDGSRGVGVWNVETGAPRCTLLPRLDTVKAVRFSPDGRLLACACNDGVALYETSEFQRVGHMRGDTSLSVAFRPDSQLIAFPSVQQNLVRLWNHATQREVAVLEHPGGPSFVAFTGDGKSLVTASSRAVRVWAIEGTREKLVLSGHGGGVPGVTFSPDGKWLASVSKDHTARIWDSSTGIVVKTLSGLPGPGQSVAFSPDGRLLATGDWTTGSVWIWDVTSGKRLLDLENDCGRLIWTVAFSPDGRYFAAGGVDGMGMWRVRNKDAADREPRLSLDRISGPDAGAASQLCFSPDSKLFAWSGRTARDNFVHVWDLGRSRVLASALGEIGGDQALAFLPDSKRCLSVGADRVAEVWDVYSQQKLSSFATAGPDPGTGSDREPRAVLSPDGRWLAAKSLSGRGVNIWETQTGKLLLALPEDTGSIWYLAWSPDANLLAVSRSDSGLSIWRIPEIRSQLAELRLDW